MSASRDSILSRVRGALQALPSRAAYPTFEDDVATLRTSAPITDLWEAFKNRTHVVNGVALDSLSEVAAWLRERKHLRGYCDPALIDKVRPAFGPDFQLEDRFDRTRVDDYAFGLTRAVGAIAETGSVILNDAATASRLGALAPWVHIAVLDRADVVPDVARAITRFGDDPNIIWCTGPSKTADVEGILIQGVHGPGVQITALG